MIYYLPISLQLNLRSLTATQEIEYARASLALPITGGSILILALVSLNFFHRTFGPTKDDQALHFCRWLKLTAIIRGTCSKKT